MGTLPNGVGRARVGLRTRRGLKGAPTRNRLKRQLRTIVFQKRLPVRPGLDMVIVLHPRTVPIRTATLEKQLIDICRRLRVLS